MTMRYVRACVLMGAIGLLLTACESSSELEGAVTENAPAEGDATSAVLTGDGADAVVDRGPDQPPPPVGDVSNPPPDDEPDAAAPGEPDAPPLEPTDCQPGDGCFGEPCGVAEDCLGGICTAHLGAMVCSKTCDESCPTGWSCQLVSSGSDGLFACVSNFPSLCLPCSTDEACGGETTPGTCVQYPDGTSFCGGACDLDTPCPQGYDCQEAPNTGGVSTWQCVASTGVCECSSMAVEAGLGTACEHTNEHGTCVGARTCGPAGLGACDALVPGPEVCNGIDDNCDGLVDTDTCDDDNPCTVDTCDEEVGCIHEALDGGECLDGDACTIGDHCEAGACVGTVIDCDDGNPCTESTCDGLAGCLTVPTGNDCDDGDDCTVGDHCANGVCESGVALACDDGNPCTDDACGPAGCVHTPNDSPCDDGNACTVSSGCVDGACLSAGLVDCQDDNPCTNDGCDPSVGCVAVPNDAPCDDLNACTQGDHCADGACQSGSDPLGCEDFNPCTLDSCNPLVGCIHEEHAGECDDSNPCTDGDSCVSGDCVGLLLACDDQNSCTVDSCHPITGCDHDIVAGACDDGDACTSGDTCINGTCVASGPTNCEDANPCTSDSCDPLTGCAHGSVPGPCDDGNPCSLSGTCINGACAPGETLICDDKNPCTDDSCAEGQCVFTPNLAPCSDGNACTLGDSCLNGECTSAGPLNCHDENPCTDDACDPGVGCTHDINTSPCEDGDPCTLQDTCAGGICGSGETLTCEDTNPCTKETCVNGACVFAADEGDCNDGNACTTGDSCLGGTCQGLDVLACDDSNPCTADACDPASGCVNTPVLGVCEDGDPCTVQDVCDDGVCASGSPISCDDGNPCTHESCIQGSCVFDANDGPCDDLNECTAQDLCIDGICLGTAGVLCDDGNACTTDACDPDNGCHYEFNNQGCSDDDVCTQGDQCAGGGCVSGAPLDCNDQNTCTIDACLTDSGCDHEAVPNDTDCSGNGPHWCQSGQCVPMEYCGDGLQNQGNEQCDDGNNDNTDFCSNDCTINAPIDVTFTTCGASGPNGPDQGSCNATYSGQPAMDQVKLAQGIQLWSVPVSGTFRIDVYGAQGGGGGGEGAHLHGDFNLNQGDVLKILVGQMGGVAPAQVGNGGGGGSFVATDSNQAMLIAGGGGGTGHNTHGSGYGQIDGHTSEHGGSGEYCGAGSGGSLGAGGEAASNCGGGVGNAGGGGGFTGDGGSMGNAHGGKSFVNNGAGGHSTGGFGGGAGSDLFIYGCGSSPHGGGGGGGYSGGGGGGNNCNGPGGGGGSFNAGVNQGGSNGANGGHGMVRIQQLF